MQPEAGSFVQVVDRWNGFSARLPRGWNSIVDQRLVWLSPPEGGTDRGVLFWPLTLGGAVPLDDLGAQVVRRLAAGDASFEAWSAPPVQHPDGSAEQAMRISRRSASSGRLLDGVVQVFVAGGEAVVSGYQAPREELEQLRPLYHAILQGMTALEPVPRARHDDPSEGAWSIEVPSGWRMSGGVDRTKGYQGSGIPAWSVEDPSTGARVFNEGTTLPMVAPAMGGFGGMMGGWGGAAWNQQPFTDAGTACSTFLLGLARQQRPDVVLDRIEPSPLLEEVARRGLQPVEMRMGGRATVSACLAFSHFAERGVPFRECLVVTNWMVPSPQQAMMGAPQHWFCVVGPAMRAPAPLFDEYLPLLRGIAASFRSSASWEQREMGSIDGKMARERAAAEQYRAHQVRETQEYEHRINREIAESHAATNAEIQRSSYNLIAGKEDVLSASGHAYKVDSGYETYWEKDDHIVGSSSSGLDSHLDQQGWRKMRIF